MTVLYLNAGDHELEFPRKLAGLRRFGKAHGWDVRAFRRVDVAAADVPALLRSFRPIGCVVEDSDQNRRLPQRLFGVLPVVYLDSSAPDRRRGIPLVLCDQKAVAEAAFRELSSGGPPAFAVVPSPSLISWNRCRIETFAALCADAGRPCRVFPGQRNENIARRAARLSAWLASLPPHVAIFATNDFTAKGVADAAAGLGMRFPRDFTLVGVDAMPEALMESRAPGVSSIELDFELAGYLAAKALETEISRRAAETQGKRLAQSPPSSQSDNENLRASASPCELNETSRTLRPSREEIHHTFGPLLAVRRESTRGRGRHEPHILEAVGFVRREACDGLTAAALASRFRVSRGHFERRFREAVGHSVLDEILQVRMQAVLDLLARPETPIAAITPFCGFGTDQELRKLFRRRFGCSMREWRVRHLR